MKEKSYQDFLESKKKSFIESGFEVEESQLNKNLFDFQKFAVKTALINAKNHRDIVNEKQSVLSLFD